MKLVLKLAILSAPLLSSIVTLGGTQTPAKSTWFGKSLFSKTAPVTDSTNTTRNSTVSVERTGCPGCYSYSATVRAASQGDATIKAEPIGCACCPSGYKVSTNMGVMSNVEVPGSQSQLPPPSQGAVVTATGSDGCCCTRTATISTPTTQIPPNPSLPDQPAPQVPPTWPSQVTGALETPAMSAAATSSTEVVPAPASI